MKKAWMMGRWGCFVGAVLALGACAGAGDGSSSGSGSGPSSSTADGLTAPRPDDTLQPASSGTESIVSSSGPDSLAVTKEIPLLNRLSSNAGKPDPTHREWHADPRAVAIEGQVAPGTGGEEFDENGFFEPTVNESGNVSFVGAYGGEMDIIRTASTFKEIDGNGAGVFFWSRDNDRLAPVAVSGQEICEGYFSRCPDDFAYPMINDRNVIAFVARNIYPYKGPPPPIAPTATTSTDPAAGAQGGDGAAADTGSAADTTGATASTDTGTADTGAATGTGSADAAATADTSASASADPAASGDTSGGTARKMDFKVSGGESALIQAIPDDDSCVHFKLKVIAKRGDEAPGGGVFYDFGDLAENENGDIAFIGIYVNVYDTAQTVHPAQPYALNAAVYLYKADTKRIVRIIGAGDPLPHTDYGSVCEEDPYAFRGVWMNDDRVITFQVDCIESNITVTTTAAPQTFKDSSAQDGSIFIKRPHEDVKLFLAVGGPGPKLKPCGSCSYDETDGHSCITDIEVDRPGLSEHEAAFLVQLRDGLVCTSALVEKQLDEDCDGKLEVCAVEEQELPRDYTLGLGAPSFSSDEIMGFIGELRGWEDNRYVEKSAAFTCFEGDVHKIVAEGDKKPVGKDNTFGELYNQSNSDRYQVFLDIGSREAMAEGFVPGPKYECVRPTGVFEANSNPQLP